MARGSSTRSRAELLVPVVVLAAAVAYVVLASRLDVGSLTMPGPGIYPTMVGAFLIVSAVIGVAQALAGGSTADATTDASDEPEDADRTDDRDEPSSGGATLRKPTLLVAAMVAYAVILEPIGFVAASALFMVSAACILNSRDLKKAVSTSLVLGAPLIFGLYLAFTRVLEVALP